jgi:phosphate-selective porin OprO and OprP
MNKFFGVLAVALIIPCVAQAKNLEDLLAEKGLITKSEARDVSGIAGPKIYWNSGTRFEFPDAGFTSIVTTYLQERYIFTDNDEMSGKKNTSSFELRNARLVLSGTALHNEFVYRLEPDFVAGRNGTERTPVLRDVFIAWNACDYAQLQLGQYKTFISRQFVSASQTLQFEEEALASRAFNLGYQNGLSGKLTSEDKSMLLRAGIFNGESSGEGQNKPGVDTRHTGMITSRYNPLGKIDAYEETDVNNSEDLALSLGATYAGSQGRLVDADEGTSTGFDRHVVNVDAVLKYQGLSLAGEFYWSRLKTDAAEAYDPIGFYVQAGYFLIPTKFEVAARYSYLDCDQGQCPGGFLAAGVDKVDEVSATLNYYFWRHSLKAGLGWSFQNEDFADKAGEDAKTNKWIFQVTSYF